MTRRFEFYISVVCFVSRVCIPHAQCWFFFGNSYCCSLDLFCSGFEVDVGHLEERIEIFPMVAGDRGNGEENGLAMAEVHPGGNGRPGGRAARNVLCCRRQRPEGERSPIHAIRKRVNSSPEGVWW